MIIERIEKIAKLLPLIYGASSDVVTPFELALKVVREAVSKEHYLDADKKVLDPCCGRGTFLLAYVYEGMKVLEKKIPDEQARVEYLLRKVVGRDINPAMIDTCKSTMYNVIGKKVKNINIKVENTLNWNTNMKFDCVIGNPPYNSDDTSRKTTRHRGQGDNLAKKFALLAIKLSSGSVSLIMPYGHRTYSSQLQKIYQTNGLYKIEKCGHYFQSVSTNPCVFYFNKNTHATEVQDEYMHEYTIPERNIGQLFKNQPGNLNRTDYESKLLDSGRYRIVVTTAIIKYTDDQSIVDGMKDNTQGYWRVVFNCTTSVGKFGKIIVEGPDSILSKSVHCLITGSEEEAVTLKAHLESEKVKDIMTRVKNVNACNSKKFLQYIPMPD